MKFSKKIKKGFTLVELVIVIAVIAVLSAVLIPVFGNVISNAKVAKAKADVRNINEKIVLRSLDDGRSSYSADEIKQILEDLGFDRASSPDGYSLWYDASVNNLRLLENKTAFRTASRTASISGNYATFAAGGVTGGDSSDSIPDDTVTENGNRPVEAINPYNRNLYYIDKTIKEVDQAISEIKGSTGSGIIAAAEEKFSTSAEISASIVAAYKANLTKIANAISDKKFKINANDLINAMSVENTLYIGDKGMYLPSFDTSNDGTPNVSCVNSLVDGGVIEITEQKLNSTNKGLDNLKINTTIVIPSRVTLIEGSVFVSLGKDNTSKIDLVIGENATFNSSGNTGATVSVSKSNSVTTEDSIKYENANIVYGTDYVCEYPTNGQYMYIDSKGMGTGTLSDGTTLENVEINANGDIRVKYLVPVFNVLTSQDGFFKSTFSGVRKLYVNNVKTGSLTKYNAIMLMEDPNEKDIIRGYKFSNIGYITNLDMHTYESYNVINHTGKTENFPTNNAQIKVYLPEGATELSNYQGDNSLKVKVTYKPVVKNYEQKMLMDGTQYYALKTTDTYTGESIVAETTFDANAKVFTLDVDSKGMATTNYSTYDSVVEKVEVYSGDTLVLVRYYY